MATNDITGDKLITKAASKAYIDNYDAIFRKKSMKVYINKDECYEHFMWDEEDLKVLDAEGSLKTIEVPLEFVKEYREYLKVRLEIQEKLSRYYESIGTNS